MTALSRRRATLVAALTVSILVGVVGCGGTDRADSSHDVYVIADVSESILRGENGDALADVIAASAKAAIESMGRLAVFPVGALVETGPIVDTSFDPGSARENESRLRDWTAAMVTEIASDVARLSELAGSRSTPLVEAVLEAERHFRFSRSEHRSLLIVSDMIQTSGELDFNNFVTDRGIDSAAWARAARSHVNGSETRRPLDGVDVYVTYLRDGVSGEAGTARADAEEAWSLFLTDLGANVRHFDSAAPELED